VLRASERRESVVYHKVRHTALVLLQLEGFFKQLEKKRENRSRGDGPTLSPSLDPDGDEDSFTVVGDGEFLGKVSVPCPDRSKSRLSCPLRAQHTISRPSPTDERG